MRHARFIGNGDEWTPVEPEQHRDGWVTINGRPVFVGGDGSRDNDLKGIPGDVVNEDGSLADERTAGGVEPGKPFVVYRLGSGKATGLLGNAGNAEGVATHIVNVSEHEDEYTGSEIGYGATITAWRVVVPASMGSYARIQGGSGGGGTVGREVLWEESDKPLGPGWGDGMANEKKVAGIWYSFDGPGFQEQPLLSIPAPKAFITKINMAGSLAGGKMIRDAFTQALKARGGRTKHHDGWAMVNGHPVFMGDEAGGDPEARYRGAVERAVALRRARDAATGKKKDELHAKYREAMREVHRTDMEAHPVAYDRAVEALADGWKHSSTSFVATQLKFAVQEELGTTGTIYNPGEHKRDDDTIDRFRVTVRRMYERTQETIEKDVAAERSAAGSVKMIVLHRGVQKSYLTRGAIESWSSDESVAKRFANTGYRDRPGKVLSMAVPYNRILVHYRARDWRNEPGDAADLGITEREYIVLSGDPK